MGETDSSERVTIAGMSFHRLTETSCVEYIVSSANNGVGGVVVTANLDHLRRYQHDDAYRRLADHADLVVADGMPIVWASRLSGQHLPERVAGSTMTWSLCRAASEKGLGVFLLGGDPGVAERAAECLYERIPGFVCAGTACPPMGFEDDEAYMSSLRTLLEASDASIVLVALGSPKQERLAFEFRELGVLTNAWWLGVGISLSFVTGDVDRAPVWLQRIGLEWMHRLAQEPRRLARRYLLQGVPFAAFLFCQAILQRFSRGRSAKV